jgi:hypothetical protein
VSSDVYPLYPKIDGGPGPGKVALLRGPIAIVDGAVVSGKATAFELLPGCHLVALETSVSEGEAKGNAVLNPPQIIFAFEMRPGYLYTVEAGAEAPTGQTGKTQVVALEHAPDGSVVRRQRATSADVKACRDWAKSQRYSTSWF